MPTPLTITKIDHTLYDQAELDARLQKARASSDVTPNGIYFRWWLEGSQGAGFTLFRRPWTTDADISIAAMHLENDRDVVELSELLIP